MNWISFDSVYAQSIADNNIRYFLPNSFLLARTSRYLIEKNQLIESLDKILKTTKGKKIIAIHADDTYQIISKSRYNDILIKIPSTNNQLNDTFFILDEKDLPKFEFKDLESKEINKFKLQKLDNRIKLYASILDINQSDNKKLKEEFITNDDDSELKVLILISFNFLIKWRKDRNIIMLSLASPYEERGILSDINEIKSI